MFFNNFVFLGHHVQNAELKVLSPRVLVRPQLAQKNVTKLSNIYLFCTIVFLWEVQNQSGVDSQRCGRMSHRASSSPSPTPRRYSFLCFVFTTKHLVSFEKTNLIFLYVHCIILHGRKKRKSNSIPNIFRPRNFFVVFEAKSLLWKGLCKLSWTFCFRTNLQYFFATTYETTRKVTFCSITNHFKLFYPKVLLIAKNKYGGGGI